MANILVRWLSSRKNLRVPDLPSAPETPGRTVFGSPRLSGQFVVREHESRRHLTLPWAEHTPVTPTNLFGYHPGSARVTANWSSFARVHLSAPDPVGSYSPAAGPAAQPFGAWHSTLQTQKWPEVAAYLQQTTLGVYKETPDSFYTGDYPSSFAAEKAHKVWFERKHLRTELLPDAPVTATTEAVIPAYFAPKQHTRHEKRNIVYLPRLDQYTRTVQSPAAYAPVTTIKRRDTARILLFPERLEETPETAKSAAVPPSYFAPPMHRRHGRSNIVLLPEFPDRKENLFPGTVKDSVNHVWYWDRYRSA